MDQRDVLARVLAALVSEAGRLVLELHAAHGTVRTKADGSPVSDVDERVEALLVAGAQALLPGVPVVAEETVSREGVPALPAEFLLVDPVDGTRELVAGNPEFTVNIALVGDGDPVVGVVFAPALQRLFLAGRSAASAFHRPGEGISGLTPIATRACPGSGLVAVVSRSHLDDRTRDFLDRLGPAAVRRAGSSLKFCLLACGEADVYPRLGPTMEWDTAAGDVVLRAAGGTVVDPRGEALRYGKAGTGLRNGPFVAWGGTPLMGL